MLQHYLKPAWRNLLKNGLFSAINIFGLALSMSVCLVALIKIREAYTYDRFHPHPDRTYRVITDVTYTDGKKSPLGTTPMPLADALKDYPFIEKTLRLSGSPAHDDATANKKEIPLERSYTDASFFDLFGFKLLYGSAATAFTKPNSAVLTEDAAALFFGNRDPVGETLEFKRLNASFTITGVIKNNGEKSFLNDQVYLSRSAGPAQGTADSSENVQPDWGDNFNSETFVLLKEGGARQTIESALATIAGTILKEHKFKDVKAVSYRLQPLNEITPGPELWSGRRGPALASLFMLGGVTLLILMLACFNYTNLSLAKSLSRLKEVGIRKVAGGTRVQLFTQFIVEAVLISLFSLGAAYGIFTVLVSYGVVPDRVISSIALDAALVLIFVVFAVFTGILAGFLPAWILSTFNPVEVFNKLANVKIFKGLGLQKTLTVIQFTVCLVVVIVMVTMKSQATFADNYAYGFDVRNTIVIDAGEKGGAVLEQVLSKEPEVKGVARSSAVFGGSGAWRTLKKSAAQEDGMNANVYFSDERFPALMGLKVLAGNSFIKEMPANQALINQFTAKSFGYKSVEAAVGSTLLVNDSISIVISGVIKDINNENLKRPVGNMVLIYAPEKSNMVTLKTYQHDASLPAKFEQVYKKVYPAATPRFRFYDEELTERRTYAGDNNMLSFLALMTVTIAFIGLLGIVTYSSRVRQKEVSIRKVMGASLARIVYLLSGDFLKLVLIAFVMAMPAGYLLGNQALRQFTYRIDLGWQIMLVSGGGVLSIALAAISSQTLRAAMANPVKSLRSE